MPKAHVVFHRLAASEYRSARDWYAARSAEVAERFRRAVDRAVWRIAGQYSVLPVLRSAYRWVRVARFPYLLICRPQSEELIIIVAVAQRADVRAIGVVANN